MREIMMPLFEAGIFLKRSELESSGRLERYSLKAVWDFGVFRDKTDGQALPGPKR
jgi:hypothetical protein